MLRIRTAKYVPNKAVSLAYVRNEMASPENNLALIEPEETYIANIVDYFGNEIDLSPTFDYADTSEFLVSNRSIVARTINRPVHLYYQYVIGRGVYDFYSRDAEAAATDYDEINSIRSRISILDADNNVAPALNWDVGIVRVDTNRFQVTLYTDRRSSHSATYKIRYPAIDAAGGITYNMIETINPESTVEVSDYSATYVPGSGYYVGAINSGEMSPALAIFSETDTPVNFNVTPTLIEFTTGAGTVSVRTSLGATGELSVEDLVADINALNVDVRATPLSDYDQTGPLLVQGADTATRQGTVVRFNDLIHIRYNEENRVSLLKPRAADTLSPWYPVINTGEFMVIDGTETLQYKITDADFQTYSYTYGFPYRDVFNEEPTILGSRLVQLSHYPLLSQASLQCYQNGVLTATNQLVEDVDIQNGIIFLRNDLHPDTSLSFSYAYRETRYEYPYVDLNPVLSPQLKDKFIGIYILPHLRTGPSGTYQLYKTVYHYVGDTYQEVYSTITGLNYNDDTPAYAMLLGTYRIMQKRTAKAVPVVDTRLPGGGLKDDVSPGDTEEPEAEYFWDNSMWGGRPIQDRGTLIMETPEEILGEVSRFKTIPDSAAVNDQVSGWLEPTGFYSIEEVQVAAQKHVKAGALPILDVVETGVWYSTGFIPFDPQNPGAMWHTSSGLLSS